MQQGFRQERKQTRGWRVGGSLNYYQGFLVPRHVAAALAEDLEELVVEALGFALLVRGVRPFTGEAGGPRSDFVSRKPHRHRRRLASSCLSGCFSTIPDVVVSGRHSARSYSPCPMSGRRDGVCEPRQAL